MARIPALKKPTRSSPRLVEMAKKEKAAEKKKAKEERRQAAGQRRAQAPPPALAVAAAVVAPAVAVPPAVAFPLAVAAAPTVAAAPAVAAGPVDAAGPVVAAALVDAAAPAMPAIKEEEDNDIVVLDAPQLGRVKEEVLYVLPGRPQVAAWTPTDVSEWVGLLKGGIMLGDTQKKLLDQKICGRSLLLMLPRWHLKDFSSTLDIPLGHAVLIQGYLETLQQYGYCQ